MPTLLHPLLHSQTGQIHMGNTHILWMGHKSLQVLNIWPLYSLPLNFKRLHLIVIPNQVLKNTRLSSMNMRSTFIPTSGIPKWAATRFRHATHYLTSFCVCSNLSIMPTLLHSLLHSQTGRKPNSYGEHTRPVNGAHIISSSKYLTIVFTTLKVQEGALYCRSKSGPQEHANSFNGTVKSFWVTSEGLLQ